MNVDLVARAGLHAERVGRLAQLGGPRAAHPALPDLLPELDHVTARKQGERAPELGDVETVDLRDRAGEPSHLRVATDRPRVEGTGRGAEVAARHAGTRQRGGDQETREPAVHGRSLLRPQGDLNPFSRCGERARNLAVAAVPPSMGDKGEVR